MRRDLTVEKSLAIINSRKNAEQTLLTLATVVIAHCHLASIAFCFFYHHHSIIIRLTLTSHLLSLFTSNGIGTVLTHQYNFKKKQS
jgi:hypothetical protein